MVKKCIFFFFVVICQWMCLAHGRDIHGVVLSIDSTPLSHAIVTMGTQTVETNPSGQFHFTDPAGINTIAVITMGFQPFKTEIGSQDSFITVFLEPLMDAADEVIIKGKRETASEMLADAVKMIKENYLKTDVALLEQMDIQLYHPNADTVFSANGTVWWWQSAKPSVLNGYQCFIDSLLDVRYNFSGTGNLSDYLFDYNDFPFGRFESAMLHAYGKSDKMENISMQNLADVRDGHRVYHHFVFLERNIQAYPGLEFSVLTEILIDPASMAIKRLRYFYVPNTLPMVTYFSSFIANQKSVTEADMQGILHDERFKMLFFQLDFALDTLSGKWFPLSYTVKNK